MQKIELPTEDLFYNYSHALKTINTSGMSRKGMLLNFIKDKDKYYCLVSTSADELPKELKQTSISYKKLKEKVLS